MWIMKECSARREFRGWFVFFGSNAALFPCDSGIGVVPLDSSACVLVFEVLGAARYIWPSAGDQVLALPAAAKDLFKADVIVTYID